MLASSAVGRGGYGSEPTLLSSLHVALGQLGTIQQHPPFNHVLHVVAPCVSNNGTAGRCLTGYEDAMGTLVHQEDAFSGTSLVYHLSAFSRNTGVLHIPVELTLHRDQSLHALVRSTCPDSVDDGNNNNDDDDINNVATETCTHMLNLLAKVYYGVDYAPTLPNAQYADFTATRTDVIRTLIDRFQYKSYLEVGCRCVCGFAHASRRLPFPFDSLIMCIPSAAG